MSGSQVTILGAGFSRAISDRMPVTDELGTLVLEELNGVPGFRFPQSHTGYFEAWLSRLCEDQPDLGSAANQLNLGIFESARAALHRILVERQNSALGEDLAPWLRTLCTLWACAGESVITFNYDTLVESAFGQAEIWDFAAGQRSQPSDLIGNLPRVVQPVGLYPGGPGTPSRFRLYKLHGSVEWYAAPGDTLGLSMARTAHALCWGNPDTRSEVAIREEMPGREPFIVPPASSKTSFYSNPILRQIWQNAGSAIEAASEIRLIGYSLPATDLTTRGMLTERTDGNTRWVIVNPYPEPVSLALQSIGVDESQISTVLSVEDYVDERSRKANEDVSGDLKKLAESLGPDTPVVVVTRHNEVSALSVPDSSSETDGAWATCDGHPQAIGQILNGLRDGSGLRLGKLARRCDRDTTGILIRLESGQMVRVIHVDSSDGNDQSTPMPCVILRVETQAEDLG